MFRLLISTLILMNAISGFAQYGRIGKSEMSTFKDAITGVEITILTDTMKNDRFLYQTDPMWTCDGKYLMFRSSSRSDEMVESKDREGNLKQWRATQLYLIEIATGNIIQITTGKDTGSGFLANRSNKLFLNRKVNDNWNMYVIDLDQFLADVKDSKIPTAKPQKRKTAKSKDIKTSYETFIGTFPKEMGRPGGFCINSEDDWAYITVERDGTQEEIERMNKNAFLPESNQPVKIKPTLGGVRKMNLKTGQVEKVCDVEFRVGHIQASRFRGDEIVFCNETGGDAFQRMWFVKSDGTNLKPLYKETPLDWVTHETFASEDYVYFNILGFQPRLRKQAHGIFRINLRNDDVDVLGQVETSSPAGVDNKMLGGKGFWHCNASRDNRWSCGDTFAGSVWIINNSTGERIQIASDCKMKPDHAQPFFSPDGTKLCFQSGHFTNGKRLNLMMVDLTKVKGWTPSAQGQKMTDANTPLHFMQPDYKIPYTLPTAENIKTSLDRVLNYVDANTPIGMRTPDELVRGAFRLTSYEWGVTYSGMLKVAQITGDKAYMEYATKRMSFLAEQTPHFQSLLKKGEKIDGQMRQVIEPKALDDAGAVCASMIKAQRMDANLELKPLIDNYMDFILNKEFRLEDGILARNRPQYHSVWLDDMFMGIPPMAFYGKFDEAAKQIKLFKKRMWLEDKQLFRHGWVESMDPHPAFFWARANGWALLTMTEVLDELPTNHPDRAEILQLYKKHVEGLVRLQSSEGFWHQLLDKSDSYLETSATAIYVYCIAHGINEGWLNAKTYGASTILGWNAVNSKINSEGQVEGTCVGTGMGFEPAFYYYRPVSPYAAHGYGPVLLAGAEVIRLIHKQHLRLNDSAIHFYSSEPTSKAGIFHVEKE